jgi:hypothetical protein
MYGAMFDPVTLGIAVNLGAGGATDARLRHELTHLMVSQVTRGNHVPAWFDEGLATLGAVMRDSRSSIDDHVAGVGIAAGGMVPLDAIATLAGWHAAYSDLGRPLYAYAALSVQDIERRIGLRNVIRILDAVGRGERFDDAYRTISGENLGAGSLSLLASINLLLPFQFLDNLVQLVEPCIPELSVPLDPCRLLIQSAQAELAGPHAPDLLRGDEPRLLQDADVLLHAR